MSFEQMTLETCFRAWKKQKSSNQGPENTYRSMLMIAKAAIIGKAARRKKSTLYLEKRLAARMNFSHGVKLQEKRLTWLSQ